MSNTTAFYYPMVAELLKIHLQYILNFILYCLKSAKWHNWAKYKLKKKKCIAHVHWLNTELHLNKEMEEKCRC